VFCAIFSANMPIRRL